MFLNDAPDHPIVHGVIAVNDSVAKVHGAPQFRNARSSRRVDLVDSLQCFADNLKFAFHCASEKTVGGVLGEALSSRVLKNALARLAHVKQ